MRWRRIVLATVALWSAPVRADEPPAGPVLRQEWIGTHTLGLVVRAEIPLSLPPSNSEPAITDRGVLFLLAFDVGFGRG